MRAAVLALVFLMLSGAAFAQTAATGGLRGAEAAVSAAPAPQPLPQQSLPISPIPGPSPALPPPSLVPQATIEQCREGCAQAYYMCSAGDDASDCPNQWTSCRADCARAQRAAGPASP